MGGGCLAASSVCARAWLWLWQYYPEHAAPHPALISPPCVPQVHTMGGGGSGPGAAVRLPHGLLYCMCGTDQGGQHGAGGGTGDQRGEQEGMMCSHMRS